MPKMDLRNFQSLLKEKRSIAPLYVPEWNASDDRDTGVALLKIFCHMQEEIINRLNRVPDKNFTAFLEMIGLKLMPAQPAKVPVTFYLPEGFSGGVFVPSGTKVTIDETERHKILNFETKNGIFANSAAIEEIYCVDPNDDVIFRYTDDFINKKEFSIFKKEDNLDETSLGIGDSHPNKQEHILYLGHKELFDFKNSGKIKLNLNFEANKGSVDYLSNLIWAFWGENEESPEELKATPCHEKGQNKNIIILELKNPKSKGETKEKKINGISNRWIFCREDKKKNPILPFITEIKIDDTEELIKPDIGFYNNTPLDLTGDFFPLGTQPRLFDTFYIASKKAFSKDTESVKIRFKVKNEVLPDIANVVLSWEYWDGTLWQPIKGINTINDKKSKFGEDSDINNAINFSCPDNIEEVEVNGIANYWIRVRLVNGNYGKDEFTIVNFTSYKKCSETKVIESYEIKHNFNPPRISDFLIYYTSSKKRTFLHNCLTYNNLEYRDFTKENKSSSCFKPFIFLPETKPTLYIGFKDAFKKGNISIFFSLKEMDYPPESRLKIRWTYWSKAPNLMAVSPDRKTITLVSTTGISSDTELLFEEKIGSETITEVEIVDSLGPNGKIVLKNELNHEFTRSAVVSKKTNLEVIDNTKHLTTTGTLEFVGPSDQSKTHKFGKESYWLMGEYINPGNEQLIKGIYPNTVWAEQVETIKDEILGSGDGEKNKSYSFFRVPVISLEIWIRYEDTISENEDDAPAREDKKEIKDSTGKTIEKWVRWAVVEDFADSSPRSRHCTIDNTTGTVQFGDGVHGMIPPIGQDNIKATYRTGGGVQGNVAENEIKTLKSSISGIDHITNHEPAEGGSDTELLSEIFERGPHLIKHRDRAVTMEDFERLARAASSDIARTKCIIKDNKLTVIVIPKGEEAKPQPSKGLIGIVKKSLLERSLNMILEESLVITGPFYKEIKVKVDIIPVSIYQAIPLEKNVLEQLKKYLHPLTGGNLLTGENLGTGWEFGRDVHISDIYTLLENVEGVDHVENLKLNNFCEDVPIEKYEIVCSGEHVVTIKLGS